MLVDIPTVCSLFAASLQIAVDTVNRNVELRDFNTCRVGFGKSSAGDLLPGFIPVQQIPSLLSPEVCRNLYGVLIHFLEAVFVQVSVTRVGV